MISVEEYARRMDINRPTVFAWLAKGYLAENIWIKSRQHTDEKVQ